MQEVFPLSDLPFRVRFAPSPTGFLHIGGARTAIYDWLLARSTGGQFILRIEDTDRTRFVAESLQDIMDSLKWLGLDWDEGPGARGTDEKAGYGSDPTAHGPYGSYFQSERLDLYHKYARQLIADGHAYYCFCSSERLNAVRTAQEAAKQPPGYDRHCRTLSPEEVQSRFDAGEKAVVRFKMPLKGTTEVYDELRGKLSFENRTLDDHILLKSDGFPTYHLAVVVDDHLMKITHAVRGEEWIASFPRHVLLYQALGWELPKFVHLPIFLAPSGGGKLSKRHGATGLKEYRDKGYLPEALFNFLLLLGWHPSDEQELFTAEEALKVFTVDRINKSPVAFSTDKLDWFNGVYIRKMDSRELSKRCLPFLQESGLLPDPCPPERFEYLVKIIPLVQERLKWLTEISELVDFFLNEDIAVPKKELLVQKKSTPEETHVILQRSRAALAELSEFSHDAMEQALRSLAETMGIKAGQVFMPLRVAITGRTATPGIFETMDALGKERVLKRLDQAITVLK